MRIFQAIYPYIGIWPFFRRCWSTIFACSFVILSACDGQLQQDVGDGREVFPGTIEFSVLAPPTQLRAVDRSALFVELELSYDETSQLFTAARQGTSDSWSTTLSVPTGTPFEITITWYDRADQERLNLVTSTRRFNPITDVGRLTIVSNFDNFDSDAFDADADAINNLQERIDGTSPFDALSPGVDPGTRQIELADCGSLPVATTQPSTDIANPLNVELGTLHSGTLLRDVVNYYAAPLEAGQYLLVVDVHDPDGVFNSNIRIDRLIRMEQLDEGGDEVQTLIDDFELDKVRFLTTIDLASPEILRLNVREAGIVGGSIPNIYTFGIFSLNDPIPAPFFIECPTVIPISSGDDSTFELQRGYENEVFLAFEVSEIRPYQLDVLFSGIEGIPGIQARVELVDEYGELAPQETSFGNELLRANTTDSELIETVTFTPLQTGLNWIRFRLRIFLTLNERYSVQTTLTQE